MSFRVEELAAAADVSVDTIRYYQARGLLDPPRRQGRVGYYADDHLTRLSRIRTLAGRGLSLATIGRLLSGELDAADEALAAALADSSPGGAPDSPAEEFGIDELARRSGIPLPLLEAVAREGLLVARRDGDRELYSTADVEVAAAGLRLLEAGLPLHEVLALARRHDAAVRELAASAVALFDAHVRQPLRAAELEPTDAARRLVDAFQILLPATVTLVVHHFERTLLEVAVQHMEQVGDPPELEAVRSGTHRSAAGPGARPAMAGPAGLARGA